MNINQVKAKLEKYEKEINVEETFKEIEKELNHYNISWNNIICIFTYNSETSIKFSFLTSPSYNINIIAKKFC